MIPHIARDASAPHEQPYSPLYLLLPLFDEGENTADNVSFGVVRVIR